jgi:hypothetical protein
MAKSHKRRWLWQQQLPITALLNFISTARKRSASCNFKHNNSSYAVCDLSPFNFKLLPLNRKVNTLQTLYCHVITWEPQKYNFTKTRVYIALKQTLHSTSIILAWEISIAAFLNWWWYGIKTALMWIDEHVYRIERSTSNLPGGRM